MLNKDNNMRLLCLLTILLFPFISEAQDFIGTRPLGMGEATRGTLMLNDAIYINPAAMAMTKQYAVDAQTVFQPSINQDLGFNVSLIDTRQSSVGAGIAYSGSQAKMSDQTVWRHSAHLALAQPISKYFSFGATGKTVFVDQKPKSKTFVNGDVGIYIVPGDFGKYVQAGAVFYNFAKDDKELPRQLAGGIKITLLPIISLTADFVKTLSADKWNTGAGLEFIHKSGISARGGFNFVKDVENSSTYSAGLGYFANKAGVYYSFRNRVDNKLQTHALSVSLFF